MRTPIVALLAAASLACVGESAAIADRAAVEIETPAPYVEVVPPLPFPGAVWLGGHWGRRADHPYWISGRYVHPRRGYVYIPHRWARHGARWHYTPGRWRRHR